MNSDIKPIVEQLKSKLTQANVEQIKQQVAQGVQLGKQIVEAKAKDLLKQSKNSKVVHDVLIPWLESEQAEKTIETMNEKLKLRNTPIMGKLLKIRQDLIDSKVAQARPADEAPAEEPAAEEAPAESKDAQN